MFRRRARLRDRTAPPPLLANQAIILLSALIREIRGSNELF